MTHSPLPYTTSGESLLDARGNVIATFLDYRDAEVCAEAVASMPAAAEEIRRLEDEIFDLKQQTVQRRDIEQETRDAVDHALRFVRSMREALTDDFATLDATIGELSELKESLE